ncbi:MAG: ATP-binding protein [Candidatus Bathyarchaeota archaeon]|nr:ATP-binding protein [Candidatus Bathyarchaeota archaeon]
MVELSRHSAKIEPSTHAQTDFAFENVGSVFSTCKVSLDKERLQSILENIPSAVILIEKPDATVTYANKRAIELYGVNPCGVSLEKHVSSLRILTMDGRVSPTKELHIYRALFNGETVRDTHVIIERADGQRFILNLSVKPLYDEQGEVTAAIAIFDDVTERVKTEQALKESEERLNMAQKIAHVGNWEYYVKEDRAVWSEELFYIFGLTPRPTGLSMDEYLAYVHPDDRKAMDQQMFNGNLMAAASFDYRIIRDDGTVRVLHTERVVREVGADKRPLQVVGVEQDITERKEAELKLQEYAKNLERLVDERTKQLRDVERLAAIGQTAGMIGHDIRNPLQAIAGELFLMRQDVDTSSDSECKSRMQESLTSIQQQIDYINKIVSDLQDYARPLQPELTEVDLCTTIPRLLNSVYVPSNIDAVARCDARLPKIKLDLTFLKRILVNLVTNAIQAMPDGGKLTIKATQQKDTVSIAVIDTGVGIPDSIKPKLFQPLMTTKSKGQGFGLAVVRRLVEIMGGTITFESKVGKGTQFILTFPKQST